MRDLRLSAISHSTPAEFKSHFPEFIKHWTSFDWQWTPGMEGRLFDLLAGNAKGTGEWSTFMFDVTECFPSIYAEHIKGIEELE